MSPSRTLFRSFWVMKLTTLMADTLSQLFLSLLIHRLCSLAEQADYQITWNRTPTSSHVCVQQDEARKLWTQLEAERTKLSWAQEVMNVAFGLTKTSDLQMVLGHVNHASRGLTRTLWVLMQWIKLFIVLETLQESTTRTTSNRSCRHLLKCHSQAKPKKALEQLQWRLNSQP